MSDGKRLIDLLSATDEFFKSRGIDAPRRNAEALFAKALEIPRIELYLQYDRPLKEHELEGIRELIRRRAKREPLQYIIGRVDFCGATIGLRPGLLIPRPETEELATEFAKLLAPGARVLDIGCGSGCISVALAKSGAHVVAVDVDATAIEQTNENARTNGVQLETVRSDLFDAEFPATARAPFDAVISNPPYIRDDEYASLQTEVRDYESKRALISGPSGLEFYQRIADLLPQLLTTGGALGLEFGIGQAEPIRTLFAPHLTSLTIHRDIQGHERFIVGRSC
ncbi:MAG: peptide chain release factor N(5)-glutamine methyltransferase [bacterium]|nr:peptide chain release factor N(5)-glutamine methyltransferase [bacterium]